MVVFFYCIANFFLCYFFPSFYFCLFIRRHWLVIKPTAEKVSSDLFYKVWSGPIINQINLRAFFFIRPLSCFRPVPTCLKRNYIKCTAAFQWQLSSKTTDNHINRHAAAGSSRPGLIPLLQHFLSALIRHTGFAFLTEKKLSHKVLSLDVACTTQMILQLTFFSMLVWYICC